EEMKGRIIGREGRNIRALEQATGVDLIIDDTPETVVISGFDPVRREVARLALTKLIQDGRIHPGRIEEVVAKARAEVDLVIRQAGEHEVEGPHAAIGAAIAQRHNLSMRVVNCIAAHHQEVEYACVEAPIVQVADAISASRPGARGESMDTYVKRLEDLQAIAGSFAGAERTFAVQAGREVRILVRPEEIDDLTATRLARDIVRKIEETLTYPG